MPSAPLALLSGSPTLSEYIALEKKCIQFLSTSTDINNHFPELFAAAVGFTNGKTQKYEFAFEATLELKLEGTPKRVFIGEKIISVSPGFETSSYFALCDEKRKIVLRKFHFDTLHHTGHKDRPHYHFQFPGEDCPLMGIYGFQVSALEPDLSLPRNVSLPLSFCLMTDYLLREAAPENPGCVKVRADENWRGIVNQHETKLLKPFFKNVHERSRHTTATSLIADFLYGL